jgi:hypothetical protein
VPAFDTPPDEVIKINSEILITVIQFGGVANMSTLEEHVNFNLNKGDYETALGLRTLVELKKDFPLETKFDTKAKANKVVIPKSVNLRAYVDRAMDYFLREHHIAMELQPIVKR